MKTEGARGGREAFRSLGSQPEIASGERDKGESFRADSEMYMGIVHSILGRLVILGQIKAMAAKAGRNTRKPASRSVHHDPSHTACPI